jgi:hypothetical protein
MPVLGLAVTVIANGKKRQIVHRMTEIKLYKSSWRAIKLILLCSIFVAIGLWGIMTDMPSWIAWFIIGFFGLGYPVGLLHLFDRRPQIIINEIGIFDRTTHKDFINWEIIHDAYPIDIYNQKFICLVVDEQFIPSKKKGKIYRKTAKFNEMIGAQELNLSLGQIRIDVSKLTEFIILMRSAKKSDKMELIAKALNEWN